MRPGSYEFNPSALLLLIGCGAMLLLAVGSNRGAWFYGAEAVASAVIILSLAGLLSPGPSKRGRR